jgi:DNA repair protein RecO (recombination protein O)
VIAADRTLVLRTYPLRDTSLIVCLLGHEHGRLRLVANGSRGRRNPFGASFVVGNEVDLVFSLAAGRELGTVREATLRRAWVAGTSRLEVMATGLAVAELLDRLVPEGARAPDLLAAALDALAALASSPDRATALLVFWRFELILLGHLGLQPALDACSACGARLLEGGWLQVGDGALRCRRCRRAAPGDVRLEPETAALLAALGGGDLGAPALAARRAVAVVLHRLLTRHVERYRYPTALRLLKKVDMHAGSSARASDFRSDPETA